MASFRHLRHEERSATAGRFGVLSGRRGRLLASTAALLALAAVIFGASQLASLDGSKTTAPAPAFLRFALGSPQGRAPLTRRPAPGIHVGVRTHGYAVAKHGASLVLASRDAAGAAPWQRFVSGVLRRTSFGSEAITLDPTRAEDFLTVTSRQGVRTWRWSLGLQSLDPKSRVDGSIALLRSGAPSGIRIR